LLFQPGSLFSPDSDGEQAIIEYEQVRYFIPSTGSANNQKVQQSIIVRRRKVGQKPSLREIFSHQHCGVDNTGNVRVWAAEEVMVHYLAQPSQHAMLVGKNVCELGAGMTGLAGIAVAASTLAKWVHVTDGNTDAVSNLSTCIEMNKIASNEESDDGDSSARRQSGIEKS
jgi:predicted nicotinamide N-methyase